MENLNDLRKKIDKIDAAIIKKLETRQKLSLKIALLKKRLNLKIKDSQREAEQQVQYKKLGLLHQLDPDFVIRLFKVIITQSRKLQKYAKK